MLKFVKYDCRSSTGSNLRNMMLLAGKTSVDETTSGCFKHQVYKEVPEGEQWRIAFAQEMIEIVSGNMYVESFGRDELEELLHHVVVS